MHRTMIARLGMLLAVLAMPAVAASPAARHVHKPVVHEIVIDQMQYGPMPADIKAGDVIQWTNHDMFEHSATARDGSFDVDLKPGASGRIVARAGSVAFFCKFHPGMTATLVVK